MSGTTVAVLMICAASLGSLVTLIVLAAANIQSAADEVVEQMHRDCERCEQRRCERGR
jgi:hypothetical protein